MSACSNDIVRKPWEIRMYIGGGIPGTILVIALIVWLVRRM
jgi:O-antigen ligase